MRGDGIIIPGVIFYTIGLILNLVVALKKPPGKRRMLTGAIVMYCLTVVFVVVALGVHGGVFHEDYRRSYDTYIDNMLKRWDLWSNRRVKRLSYVYDPPILSWSFGMTCIVPFGCLILTILAAMSCYESDTRSVREIMVSGANAPVVGGAHAPMMVGGAPAPVVVTANTRV